MLDAVKFNVEPAHKGLLLEAVGAAGVGLTVTVTYEGPPGQLPSKAVTV